MYRRKEKAGKVQGVLYHIPYGPKQLWDVGPLKWPDGRTTNLSPYMIQYYQRMSNDRYTLSSIDPSFQKPLRLVSAQVVKKVYDSW